MVKFLSIPTLLLFNFFSMAQTGTTIRWPEEYEPSRSKFYVHNEIEISAPPRVVWEILMQAEQWPDWYEGASGVSVNTDNRLLQENASFQWKTMGLDFVSTIREFVPNERLSWESKKRSIRGYHAWLILPTETGCRVITDESQNGWLTFFEKLFQRKKLHGLHDVWLSELKKKAEAKTGNSS